MRLRVILSALVMLAVCFCAGINPAWANAKVTKRKIISLKPANSGGPSGIAKASFKLKNSRWNLQVILGGLPINQEYHLLINDRLVSSGYSDATGAIEFNYRYQASTTNPQSNSERARAASEAWRYMRDISIMDDSGNLVAAGIFENSLDSDIEPNAIVDNVTVEVNKVATVPIISGDPNGDSVVYTVACDKGSFVTVENKIITAAPKDGDVGFYACKLTATDRFNLTTEALFSVTVLPPNRPPTISPIPDQLVKVNEVKRFTIQASDPNGDTLSATLISNIPALSSIKPNGGNSFIVELSPKSETDGGRVAVAVTDPGGLTAQISFNVVVEKLVTIASVNRVKPNLFISGNGFGSAGARVLINGVDVTAKVVGQGNQSITLRGPNKKLNLKGGANQVIVTSGGVSSAPFILNVLTE